jgi:hypothetical protein
MSARRCLPAPVGSHPIILKSHLTHPPTAVSCRGVASHVAAAGGSGAEQAALAARTRRLREWLSRGGAIAINIGQE